MTVIFEAGTFFLILGIAFLFMFINIRKEYGYALKTISFVLFLTAAMVMFGQQDVAYTTTNSDGVNPPLTTEHYIIFANGNLALYTMLAWIFMFFGILSLGLIFMTALDWV
jgi:hypothetical protein